MSANDSLNALGKLSSFLEWFARAKTVLESAALLEAHEAAMNQRISDAHAAALTAEARQITLEKEVKRVEVLLGDNQASADAVLEKAKEDAKAILDDVKQKAEVIRDGAMDLLQSASVERDNANKATTEACEKLAAAESLLADTLAQIETAKEAARKAFGA